MNIRFATPEDVPAIIQLAATFQKHTRFRAYEFNPERLAKQIWAALKSGQGKYCIFLAENNDGQFVGLLAGCIEQHVFSDRLIASVMHYDVLPDKRMGGAGLRLLTAFRKWAENRGAHELNVGVTSGERLEQMDRFLKKLGFQLTGGNYALPLGRSSS